jgi:uncharacterized protein with GYD domain
MATFISLVSLTEQGVKDAKKIPDRIAATEKLFEQVGAKLKDVYLVMGEYDYVAIAEAPDAATAAKAILSLGSKGNVRTVTLQAFSRKEIAAIIKGVK